MLFKKIKIVQYTLITNILFILLSSNCVFAQSGRYCKDQSQDLTFTIPLEIEENAESSPNACNTVKNIWMPVERPGISLDFNTVTVTNTLFEGNFYPFQPVLFYLETGPTLTDETCVSDTIAKDYFLFFNGRDTSCPYTHTICQGEEQSIGVWQLGVFVDDFYNNDENAHYAITDEHGNTVYEGDNSSYRVSPEVTTAYTLTWNDNFANPTTGIGYFLVEVETCEDETDLSAGRYIHPKEVTSEGGIAVRFSVFNNGPGIATTIDFVLEVNEEIVEIKNWTGGFSPDEEIGITFNEYSFKADQPNHIRIWSENPNGLADLNPSNDTLSYSIAAFESRADISLSNFLQPTLPISTQSSLVEATVKNYSNVHIDEFTINWTLNGINQTPYILNNPNWVGRTLNVVFGSANFNAAIDNSIVAWVTLGNEQVDINPDNNSIELFYSAANANYYNADTVITICKGDAINLAHKDSISSLTTCCVCTSIFENPEWQLNNILLTNETNLSLSPTESSFLSFTTNTFSNCEYQHWIDIEPEECFSGGPGGPNTKCQRENPPIDITYGIIVLDCESEILGCLDETACNYLPAATISDNSCSYNNCTSLLDFIECPTNNTTAICAPVTVPPPLKLQDFITTDDVSLLNTFSFQVQEQTDIQKYFTTTNYSYTISDETSNQLTCETSYHVANQFLQAPEVSPPGSICEEDLWSYIKIGNDQYKIYADDKGRKGEEMSTCNTAGLICSTADFGVDTDLPGSYNFWATTYFEFPDGSTCESEAMPFYVDVQAKPIAELSTQNKTIQVGEGIALMDLVTTNQRGYWSGENIVYLMTATGENIAYFSSNTAGVNKLYYTVSNGFCERSYLMIVEVASAGKPGSVQASYKTANQSFNIYPNPTSDKVFIDLPDEAVYQISLINVSGKIMKQLETDLHHTQIEIEVNDLPKGMYLVELKSESTYMLQKLLIE